MNLILITAIIFAVSNGYTLTLSGGSTIECPFTQAYVMHGPDLCVDVNSLSQLTDIGALLQDGLMDDVVDSYKDVGSHAKVLGAVFKDAINDIKKLFRPGMKFEDLLDVLVYPVNVIVNVVASVAQIAISPVYRRVCNILFDQFAQCETFARADQKSEYLDYCVTGVQKLQKENMEVQSLVTDIMKLIRLGTDLVSSFSSGGGFELDSSTIDFALGLLSPFYGGLVCMYMQNKDKPGKEDCVSKAKIYPDDELSKWMAEFTGMVEKIRN